MNQAAGGALPNTPLPTSLPADAVQTLQVIAYNEIFEVAFFSSLLANVTNGVTGYTNLNGLSKEYVTSILRAVVAVSFVVRRDLDPQVGNPLGPVADIFPSILSKSSFMLLGQTLS